MASPFPGMDPYLEGWLWPDVHSRMAVAISNALVAVLDPRYSVRIETRIAEDEDLVVMVPDLLVHGREAFAPDAPEPMSSVATLTAPVILPTPAIRHTPTHSVSIRLPGEKTLVTSIELVSPANKAGIEYERFQAKWERLRRAGVHVVVVDLIRRGKRIPPFPTSGDAAYLVTVTRAGSSRTEAWPIPLHDTLPTFPVPLLSADADAEVDLQAVMAEVYTQGRYTNDIDYSGAPPAPPLSDEDARWLKTRLAEFTSQAVTGMETPSAQ